MRVLRVNAAVDAGIFGGLPFFMIRPWEPARRLNLAALHMCPRCIIGVFAAAIGSLLFTAYCLPIIRCDISGSLAELDDLHRFILNKNTSVTLT